MSKLIGSYKNGNYYVSIFSDGTKIRQTKEEEFIPSFAENCDVKITDKCDGGCAFCYEGCTPGGKHGDILNYKFLDTLHPYTELAINGNDLSHPDLLVFLQKMKDKKIIVNMTVNQIHFEQHYSLIRTLIEQNAIYGLGVSLREPTDEFINMITQIPNAVIHVINGIVSIDDLIKLADNNLKILILGYKALRRGKEYLKDHDEYIDKMVSEMNKYLLSEIIPNEWFKVVSFDNLAISQLRLKKRLSSEEWEKFYMGDDGDFTFYIDMIESTFGKNSLASDRYVIMDSIDEMFEIIRKEKEEIK